MREELRNGGAIGALICLIVFLLLGLAAARYLTPKGWGAWTVGLALVVGLLPGLLGYRRKRPRLTKTAFRGSDWSASSTSAHDELLKTALEFLRQHSLDETIDQMHVAVLAEPANKILAVSLAGLLIEKERRQKRQLDFKGASASRSAAEALLDRHGQHDLLLNTRERDTRERSVRSVVPVFPFFSAKSNSNFHGLTWLLIGLSAAALALFLIVTVSGRRKTPRIAAPDSLVQLQIAPETAAVQIDGKPLAGNSIPLRQGEHQIRIQSEGYDSLNDVLMVGASPVTYAKRLTPSRLLLEFETSIDTATALLDGNDVTGAVQMAADRNEHYLLARFPDGEMPVRFSALPAAIPVVHSLPPGNGKLLVVVASFANRAVVYASRRGISVNMDDKLIGQASLQGLTVTPRTTDIGTILSIGEGKQRREIHVNKTDPPRLNVFAIRDERVELRSAGLAGSILVLADQNNAQVWLDGQKVKETIPGGRLLITPVQAGTHSVTLRKEGSCVFPRELIVKVAGSEQMRAAFKLQPFPFLRLTDPPPGARVFVDAAEVSSRSIMLTPSVHRIRIVASGFEDWLKEVDISCGDVDSSGDVTFDLGNEMTRARARVSDASTKARLNFTVEPSNASVAVLRLDGTSAVDGPVTAPLELEPGAYRLHGSLTGYEDGDVQFSARAGENTPGVFLRLVALRKTEVTLSGSESWSRPLVEEKQGWAKASDLSLYGDGNASGAYMFRLRRRGSLRRKFFGSWIVAYRPPGDYVEFRIDGKELQFRQSGSAAWTKAGQFEMPWESNELYVKVDIGPGTISTSVGRSSADTNAAGPAVSTPAGRFGLAKDTQIADFRHLR